MMAEISMETDNCKVYFCEISNSVFVEWKGYSTSLQFKKIVETMLKTLVKHNAFKVLADIKDMTIIGQKDQEWIINNFFPRAFDQGLKAVSIIKPLSLINQAAVGNIIRKVDKSKLTIRPFDNKADALQWLNSL